MIRYLMQISVACRSVNIKLVIIRWQTYTVTQVQQDTFIGGLSKEWNKSGYVGTTAVGPDQFRRTLKTHRFACC